MSTRRSWLTDPAPQERLPIEQLEERIRNLLGTHNTAVIATVNDDGSPNATPVRYGALGFEIFYTSWDRSPKSRNLLREPRVAAGIVAPLVGPASSRGCQIVGTARHLPRSDSASDRYWRALPWESDHVASGHSLDHPPQDPITVITPERIVYTDHWLRRSGYAPRQTWRPRVPESR